MEEIKKEPKKKRKYKSYSKAFKQDACKMVTDQCLSISRVAKDLGISDRSIRDWLRLYRANQDIPSRAEPNQNPKDIEIKDLKSDLRRIRMERDILKKAMAYFAKEPS